jgi:hypothetical protein
VDGGRRERVRGGSSVGGDELVAAVAQNAEEYERCLGGSCGWGIPARLNSAILAVI